MTRAVIVVRDPERDGVESIIARREGECRSRAIGDGLAIIGDDLPEVAEVAAVGRIGIVDDAGQVDGTALVHGLVAASSERRSIVDGVDRERETRSHADRCRADHAGDRDADRRGAELIGSRCD